MQDTAAGRPHRTTRDLLGAPVELGEVERIRHAVTLLPPDAHERPEARDRGSPPRRGRPSSAPAMGQCRCSTVVLSAREKMPDALLPHEAAVKRVRRRLGGQVRPFPSHRSHSALFATVTFTVNRTESASLHADFWKPIWIHRSSSGSEKARPEPLKPSCLRRGASSSRSIAANVSRAEFTAKVSATSTLEIVPASRGRHRLTRG